MSFKINDSLNCGRFVTATKAYKLNEIILDEAPLVVAPVGFKTVNIQEGASPVFLQVKSCISCLKFLTNFPVPCIRCKFPLCSETCQEEPSHKRYECVLFKKNKIQPNQIIVGRLFIIRACLMYKDKENVSTWKEFRALSSRLSKETATQREINKRDIITETKFINHVCKLEVDSTTIGIIIRTFMVNAFYVDAKDKNGSSYTAEVVYTIGSLFNHSCAANSDWTVIPRDQNGVKGWNLCIYAKRNIRCNEPITISYIPHFLNSDTATRKTNLAKALHFDCLCQRCIDKSEFGFYTSALRCYSCANTSVLPNVSNNEFSPWTCSTCGDCKDFSVMKACVEHCEKRLLSVLKKGNETSNMEFQSRLESVINSYSERILTANHRVVTRTIFYWLQAQSFEDLLEYKMKSRLKFIKIMERAVHCLIMFRMFAPSEFIVSVELVFAYAVASYYFKTESQCSIEYDQYSTEEKQKILSALYGHFKIAVQIMMRNPNSEFYSPFIDKAVRCFKFWKTQFESLNGVETVDIEGVDMAISSKGFLINGAMRLWYQVKTSVGKFCSFVYQLIGMTTEDSNFVPPDVSLLSHYDCTFTS